MLMTILYWTTAVLWGIYALIQQMKHNPNAGIVKEVCVLMTNVLIAPICIFIAIVRGK